jgi:hypothetical protein
MLDKIRGRDKAGGVHLSLTSEVTPMRNRFTKVSAVALLALAAFLLISPRAYATAIFGDIAGTVPFSGYEVGPGGGINNAIAEGFTMTGDYNLQSVDITLGDYTHAAGSNLVLSIYSNNGSNNPGSDLYDLSTNVTGPVSPNPVQTINFTGTGSFILHSGTTYWLNLYASVPASATGDTVLWVGANTGNPTFIDVNPTGVGATDIGQLRSIQSGNPPVGTPQFAPGDRRTAFQLNGVAVPEPSSVLLAACGLLGLIACGWRSAKR